MNITTDWLYDEKRMEFRENCLSILLKRFGSELNEDGSPSHSTESIYNCAHDWVSQGNVRTDGIIKYYEAYYKGQ